MSKVPAIAAQAVLGPSGKMPCKEVKVEGYNFENGVDYHALLSTYKTSGFQATNFGLAVDRINEMVNCSKKISKIFICSTLLNVYIYIYNILLLNVDIYHYTT